jgi:hypothetical protein
MPEEIEEEIKKLGEKYLRSEKISNEDKKRIYNMFLEKERPKL